MELWTFKFSIQRNLNFKKKENSSNKNSKLYLFRDVETTKSIIQQRNQSRISLQTAIIHQQNTYRHTDHTFIRYIYISIVYFLQHCNHWKKNAAQQCIQKSKQTNEKITKQQQIRTTKFNLLTATSNFNFNFKVSLSWPFSLHWLWAIWPLLELNWVILLLLLFMLLVLASKSTTNPKYIHTYIRETWLHTFLASSSSCSYNIVSLISCHGIKHSVRTNFRVSPKENCMQCMRADNFAVDLVKRKKYSLILCLKILTKLFNQI